MEKKKLLIYISVVLLFAVFLFFLFYTNTIVSNKSLVSSVETVKKDTDNEAVRSAKRYVEDNINKYDGYTDISVETLKREGYMTGDEIYEKTNLPFSDDLRVSVLIKDKQIVDAFLKNIPFNILYECTDVCYVNIDNYIAIGGKIYRILKLDYENNIYITDNTYIRSGSNIEDTLSNYYNDNYDPVFKNALSISYNDINNSTFINKEESVIVNTGEGYKKYNIINNMLEDIPEPRNSYIIPVIMLKNDVMYENGTGTSMDPFIINE